MNGYGVLVKKLYACGGYQVPPSVDIGCLSYFLVTSYKNLSATNIFRSFDMLVATIFLVSDSIATQHSHMNSEEPTFI